MSERKQHTWTAEEQARWRAGVEEELQAMPENIARAKRFRAALAEPGVAGQLRRAIVDRHIRTADLAEQAGVSFESLDGFLFGESPLDSDAFARVAAALRYELVQAAG
jgi:hypothetical protein